MSVDFFDFYWEYHGHTPEHLDAAHAALLASKGGAEEEPGFIYFIGDSSLDNKHWLLPGTRKLRSRSISHDRAGSHGGGRGQLAERGHRGARGGGRARRGEPPPAPARGDQLRLGTCVRLPRKPPQAN